MKYLDPQLRELCNAIVLQAVTDCKLGRMSRAELRSFLSSSWGVQLLRGSTTPEAIMEVIRGDTMSAYDFIIDIVTEWCIGKYWCDMLVTLRVGGEVFSTILEYDAGTHSFVFVSDWYEGEDRVQLLGFKPLAECLVLTDPDGESIHDATWRAWA